MKYEKVIAERMRKRMSQMGRVGAEITNNGVRPNEPTPNNTSKRKELAKIAGTSEGKGSNVSLHPCQTLYFDRRRIFYLSE